VHSFRVSTEALMYNFSMRILLFILFFISSTTFVYAQGTEGYVPIVGVPGLEQAGGLTAQQYVEALYKLSIAVGAMLAVIQIIFAGVQYMLTDVIPSKSDAISRIRGALLGLVILLGAVLILETINPDLLNLNIFSNAPSINQITGAAPSNSPNLPDHLKPPDGQTVSLIACSEQGADCRKAVDTCKSGGGNANISNQINGSLPCYKKTDNSNPQTGNNSSCAGYFDAQTKTCFDNIIKLDKKFEDERGDIQAAECQSLGGRFNYQNAVCTRR
jgi:hypothetical protein